MNNKSGEVMITILVIITVIPLLLGFYSDAKMVRKQQEMAMQKDINKETK